MEEGGGRGRETEAEEGWERGGGGRGRETEAEEGWGAAKNPEFLHLGEGESHTYKKPLTFQQRPGRLELIGKLYIVF